MKFMVCPQCGISNFYVMNEKGERVNIKVNRNIEIIPMGTDKSLEGFNLDKIFCLGCSWRGTVNQLKKYLV
ncbi:MAG: hypothetical protein KQH79_07375 [Bacteroidetes bacterium]|nr:hypothetical protein [Bacteroidota bacterium]